MVPVSTTKRTGHTLMENINLFKEEWESSLPSLTPQKSRHSPGLINSNT